MTWLQLVFLETVIYLMNALYVTYCNKQIKSHKRTQGNCASAVLSHEENNLEITNKYIYIKNKIYSK